MSTDHTVLPSYRNPPLVETVLTMQFNKVPGFTNAHLGLFWERLGRSAWPSAKDAGPTEISSEEFDEKAAWIQPGFRVSQDPASKLQLRNTANDRMIQLQRDRLSLNWVRSRNPNSWEGYPSYGKFLDEFKDTRRLLIEVLRELDLKEPDANQWEVIYVNRIDSNGLWKSPADWPGVFSGLLSKMTPAPSFVKWESVRGNWVFQIPEKRGRLHVELVHGKSSTEDEPPALFAKLTARGPIDDKEEDGVVAGLNLGHETIVWSFTDLTSPEAHIVWKREQ